VPTRADMGGGNMISTWNPEMGIKFGGGGGGGGSGTATQNEGRSPSWQQPQQQNNQTWDPNKGFKFG